MKLEPKHYYLTNQYAKRIKVPRSEMRCLTMLSCGRTAKEIARAFDLSLYTIERQIRNVKIKLGCNTKSELLNILESYRKSV